MKNGIFVVLFMYVMLSGLLILCSGCRNKDLISISGTEDSVPDCTGTSYPAAQESAAGGEISDTKDSVVVYVCGAVAVSGVYELAAGSRIADCVEAAGGFAGDADADCINLAREVSDGEQIRIPRIGEENAAGYESQQGLSSESSDGGKININTAGKEQLMTLSGIGESKAEAIISYREKNGKFDTIEDIMNIEGIKQGVFNKIKESICVK